MLHPTMLDDVGPTCRLRLNRPLQFFISVFSLFGSLAHKYRNECFPFICHCVKSRNTNILKT